MKARDDLARGRRTGAPWRGRRRPALLGSCLAAAAALASGCVLPPRQPAPPAVPVPPNAAGAVPVPQAPAADPSNTFQKTATDRQRFQVRLDFGKVFEVHGEFDQAAQEYQEALAVAESKGRERFTPADRALAHRRLAGALDRLGRFPQAEEHYRKALKLSPRDPRIWNDAGYSNYLQGRWADAERAFNTDFHGPRIS
jgi:tetratricopeptide (TPR) repeat protein